LIRPPRATEPPAPARTSARLLAAAFGIALAVAFAATAREARAQGQAQAEQLFLDGRRLMEQKRYAEACPKLESAYALDATATGTLLNLALCHEAVGKRATAWAELRQVAAESAGRRQDRVDLARAHEAKLLPLLAYVAIVVPKDARAPGLTITLDGRQIPDGAWGTDLPIDPGAHAIRAEAPGREPVTKNIAVADTPERRRIEIGPLARAEDGAGGARAATGQRPGADSGAGGSRDAGARGGKSASNGARTLGFVLVGAGLASAATGGVFGVLAANKNDDATGACPGDRCPTPEARDGARASLSAAKTDALVSDVTLGAGVVLAAAGVYLVLTSRAAPAPAHTSRAAPAPAPARTSRAAPAPAHTSRAVPATPRTSLRFVPVASARGGALFAEARW
jgi:hypothetical protein